MSHSHVIPSARHSFQRELVGLIKEGICNYDTMMEAVNRVAGLHEIGKPSFWRNAHLFFQCLSVGLVNPSKYVKGVVAMVEKQLRRLADGSLPSEEAVMQMSNAVSSCVSIAYTIAGDIVITEDIGHAVVKAKTFIELREAGEIPDLSEFEVSMKALAGIGDSRIASLCSSVIDWHRNDRLDECIRALIVIERIIAADGLHTHNLLLTSYCGKDEEKFSSAFKLCARLDAERNLIRVTRKYANSEIHQHVVSNLFHESLEVLEGQKGAISEDERRLMQAFVFSVEMPEQHFHEAHDQKTDFRLPDLALTTTETQSHHDLAVPIVADDLGLDFGMQTNAAESNVDENDALIIDNSIEMVSLFAEESLEVVDEIVHAIQQFKGLPPEDKQSIREAVADIRLGFHTLKGSARVVGQEAIGEAAYKIEKLFNDHIDSYAQTTSQMIETAAIMANTFRQCISSMASTGKIDDSVFEAKLDVAISQFGQEVSQTTNVDKYTVACMKERAQDMAEPTPSRNCISESTSNKRRRASKAVIELAKKEVLLHAKTLAENIELHVLPGNNEPVPEEFLRAAHTLAGVYGTIGQHELEKIATAIEVFCNKTESMKYHLSTEHHQVLVEAVVALSLIETTSFDTFQSISDADNNSARINSIEPQIIAKDADTHREVVESEITLPVAEQTGPQLDTSFELFSDDADKKMLVGFVEEMDGLRPQISQEIVKWKETEGDREHHEEICRLIHTVKGNARMAGAMKVGEVAHRLEDGLNASTYIRNKAAIMMEVEAGFDEICRLTEELSNSISTVTEESFEGTKRRKVVDRNIRVNLATIAKIIEYAGESDYLHASQEVLIPQIINANNELHKTVAKLKHQLREIEIHVESDMQSRVSQDDEQFDPLEFDRFTHVQETIRSANETMFDAQSMSESLNEYLNSASVIVDKQDKIGRKQSHELMNVRMSTFAEVEDRLHRVVRQAAKDTWKKVNLDLVGGTLHIDHEILEVLAAPIEHMLRNSVVHGIEPDRAQCAKEEFGNIRIEISIAGKELIILTKDDGGGINLKALKLKALQAGLLQPGDGKNGSDIADMIFESGISTAESLTEMAGRGIGMNVVRSAVENIGGRVHVIETSNSGTCIEIRVPIQSAMINVLIVRAGEEIYAIPASLIKTIKQVMTAEMADVLHSASVEWNGIAYPFYSIVNLVGSKYASSTEGDGTTFVLLRNSALHVDSAIGIREIAIQPPGAYFTNIAGIHGISSYSDGRTILVIDPEYFIKDSVKQGMDTTSTTTVVGAKRDKPVVMVVDDSLTIRKVTSKFLLENGYNVTTASDGLDALSKIDSVVPDVMVLDIEMPRMNGFDLAKTLRQSEKFSNLPIVMVTSRMAGKHRKHAAEVGINDFLGKPFRGGELLRAIASHTSARHS